MSSANLRAAVERKVGGGVGWAPEVPVFYYIGQLSQNHSVKKFGHANYVYTEVV